MVETERADEAETFAAGVADRKYEYTETLEASVTTDLKLSLAVALEDRDAARASHTPALAKLTAKYASFWLNPRRPPPCPPPPP